MKINYIKKNETEIETLLIKNDIKELNDKYNKLYEIFNSNNVNIRSVFSSINTDNKTMGFLYLIKEREFCRSNEEIYKVGCTENINKRFSQYPKNSLLLFLLVDFEFRKIEKLWIKQLTNIKELKRRKDIGSEYFEGNYFIIINELIKIKNAT